MRIAFAIICTHLAAGKRMRSLLIRQESAQAPVPQRLDQYIANIVDQDRCRHGGNAGHNYGNNRTRCKVNKLQDTNADRQEAANEEHGREGLPALEKGVGFLAG